MLNKLMLAATETVCALLLVGGAYAFVLLFFIATP